MHHKTIRYSFLALPAMLLLASLLLISCSSGEPKEAFSGTVTKVVDGDTIDVDLGDKTERVRFLLVDTPETKHPTKPVQPFGIEAYNYTRKLLEHKQVKLELDVSDRDKYGRLLAYVWVNGEMVNRKLLAKGLARVAYIYPPNVKYVDDFKDIQKSAQAAEEGIWSIENYTRDDGFHAENVLHSAGPGAAAKSAAASDRAASAAGDPSPSSSFSGCENPTIKGNINSKGDHIYHKPGDPSYAVTKAESMFCTEEEAQKDGFRAPLR